MRSPGLLTPDTGRIELPDGVVFGSELGINLPPQVRNVGYVVQNLALFPHLTVAENIGFALVVLDEAGPARARP